jgi:hypothetical protein
MNLDATLGAAETSDSSIPWEVVALETTNWQLIYEFLRLEQRRPFMNETVMKQKLNRDRP